MSQYLSFKLLILPCALAFLLAAGGCSVGVTSNTSIADGGKDDFGITSCQNPIYKVEAYTPLEQYPSSPLYVATTELPEEYQEQFAAINPGLSASFGTPIRLFAHTESQDTASLRETPRYWAPILRHNELQQLYLLEQSDNTPVPLAYSDSYVTKISSLAGKTSLNHPMYLVADALTLYAVIDTTAYCLNDWDELPTGYIPDIDTANLEVSVQKIS